MVKNVPISFWNKTITEMIKSQLVKEAFVEALRENFH